VNVLSALMTWIVRFTKYNLIGLVNFPICTLIYYGFYYSPFAWVAWYAANFLGGITFFIMLQRFNKKQHGLMFEEK
jgi:hypothetical protein